MLRLLQAFQDAWPGRIARQQKNYSGLHLALAQDPINVVFRSTREEFVEYRD